MMNKRKMGGMLAIAAATGLGPEFLDDYLGLRDGTEEPAPDDPEDLETETDQEDDE